MNPADIEARELQKEQWREIEKIADSEVCAVCGANLVTPWDAHLKQIVLRCSNDKTHTGHVKVDVALQRLFAMQHSAKEEGESTENIDAAIQDYQIHKNMKGGRGMSESTALAQYRETHVITKEQALEVIRTTPGWEEAPLNVVTRAAMICRDYKFYPGIHLFLLKFKGKEGDSWVPVLGIKATRLMASRRKPYKYVDGPRMASPEEAQGHYLDEYDSNLIYAVCKLQGIDGSTAEGWGTWPRTSQPYGQDKGNSKANMAEIRAERRALDRLAPGDLPGDLEVVDEQYVPQGIESSSGAFPEGARMVDQTTGEIVGGEPTEDHPGKHEPLIAKFGVCPIHHVPLIEGNSGSVYCPKKVDGKWCKEWKKKAEQPPLTEAQG